MWSKFFIGVPASIAFLFIFWKRLKEDYASYMIFNTAFLILGGMILMGFLVERLAPSWWFWGATLGGFVGFLAGVLKYRMRFFETFEAASFGLLPWLGLIFFDDSVRNLDLVSFGAFSVIVGLIFLFYFLGEHYKNFTWYTSGRAGFAGLTTIGTFFIIRAAVALLFPFVLSFVGKYEVVLSSVVAFTIFLFIYNLARKKI